MKKLKNVSRVVAAVCGFAILIVSCKKNSSEKPVAESDFETMQSNNEEVFMIDGSPVSIKKKNNVYYLYDDIMLTERQANILKMYDNKKLTASERSTVTTELRVVWPQGKVYYKISDEAKRRDILNAMAAISAAVPSVKFVERTTERNYCQFEAANENSSYVGMVGGAQSIKLYNRDKHVIMHEIFHALGIDHEQNHPERDKYIKLNFANTESGVEYNFQISPNSKGIGAVDFNSIMLYGSYDFSINGRPVMTKLDGSTFEGGTQLSTGDIAGLKYLYGGSTTTTEPAPPTPPTPTEPAPPTPPTPTEPAPPTVVGALQNGKKYVIVAKAGNKVLDINEANSAISMNTQVSGKASQQWIATEVAPNIWAFESGAQANTVLEISNERYYGYNTIKAGVYQQKRRQLFRIEKNSDQTITIAPYANPGTVLYAVSAKSGNDGAPVVVYYNTRLNNQKFTLIAQD